MLTELEAVFRGLKSELGLRAVFHNNEKRTEGHLLITVLAYQLVQATRRELEAAGVTLSGARLREILSVKQRSRRRSVSATAAPCMSASPRSPSQRCARSITP
jgi:transposase